MTSAGHENGNLVSDESTALLMTIIEDWLKSEPMIGDSVKTVKKDDGFEIGFNYPTNSDEPLTIKFNRKYADRVVMGGLFSDFDRGDKLAISFALCRHPVAFRLKKSDDEMLLALWKDVYIEARDSLRDRLMQAMNDVWRATKEAALITVTIAHANGNIKPDGKDGKPPDYIM